MEYSYKDAIQASVGAFVGVFGILIFLIFLEPGNLVPLKPSVGIIFTIILLSVMYLSSHIYLNKKDSFIHLVFDYGICLVVSIFFGLLFKITTWQIITSTQFFGSVILICSWIILLPALIADLKGQHTFYGAYLANIMDHSSNLTPQIVKQCRLKYDNDEDIVKCIIEAKR